MTYPHLQESSNTNMSVRACKPVCSLKIIHRRHRKVEIDTPIKAEPREDTPNGRALNLPESNIRNEVSTVTTESKHWMTTRPQEMNNWNGRIEREKPIQESIVKSERM
ncbi:hypothetical protein SAY87_024179 [Trapa incisa]|uniref:Uncharacterized protein n=1 Tax=Trapa incisa TaxID=236973 RepID=A0AAN7KTU5_9MYRT|nr:hypothetical protein SAY87_024179 [Trapa incisa]